MFTVNNIKSNAADTLYDAHIVIKLFVANKTLIRNNCSTQQILKAKNSESTFLNAEKILSLFIRILKQLQP